MPRIMVPLNRWFRWFRRWPRAVAASCVEIAAALDFRARSLNFSGLFRTVSRNCGAPALKKPHATAKMRTRSLGTVKHSRARKDFRCHTWFTLPRRTVSKWTCAYGR
jgi:hypothetical protein